MSKMLRTWSVLPLSLAVVALSGSAAHAEDCGNVSSAGTCLDSKTLVWCVAGQLRTMICPSGEVCVAHERFGGSSGCIATEYTECGPITESGQCAAGDRAVVWCDVSRVRARMCDDGLACAWVDEEGWYDCVAARRGTSGVPPVIDEPEPEEPGDDPDDVIPPPDESEHLDGPLPEVEKGGAVKDLASGGSGGCRAAASDLPAPWLVTVALLSLAALALRRRRTGDLEPGAMLESRGGRGGGEENG